MATKYAETIFFSRLIANLAMVEGAKEFFHNDFFTTSFTTSISSLIK